jgi:hypothetical protein
VLVSRTVAQKIYDDDNRFEFSCKKVFDDKMFVLCEIV